MARRVHVVIAGCSALLACSDASNAQRSHSAATGDAASDPSHADESGPDARAPAHVDELPREREPRPVDRSELPAESGCLEERTPIAGPELTAIGASADSLLALTSGARTETLTWRDGGTTTLTLTFHGARAFWVEARRDPNYAPLIFRSCRAHVRIEADATLTTDDGALNEHFPRLPLIAYQGDLLLGETGGIDARDLGGSYAPAIGDDQCFEAVQLDFGLSATFFRGTMTDQIASDACDEFGPLTGVGARRGATWGDVILDESE